MTESYEQRVASIARKALSKCRGGEVELWKYRVAHRGMTLRISVEHEDGCLLMFCGDVERYCGPLRWYSCDLDVQIIETESVRNGFPYRVFDRSEGFELVCGLIEVKKMQDRYPR